MAESYQNEDTEWEDINSKQDDDITWETAAPKNISVVDDDSGNLYSVPVTFDEQDIRFAIATQENKEPKENFFGKLKATAHNTWNAIDAIGYGIEDVFKNFDRGLIGFTGDMADTYLGYGRKNLMKDIDELENYNPEEHHDKQLSLNAREALFSDLSDEKRQEMIQKRRRAIEKINNTRAKWKNNFNNLKNSIKDEKQMSSTDTFVEGLGSGVGSMAVSAGALMATKNPQVAAGILAAGFGAMRNVEVFDKAIDAGHDYKTADTYGTIAGTIEGGIELALEPLYYSFANWRPVKKITKNVIETTLQKMSTSKIGSSAATKIINHEKSILKQSAKSFLTEGTEEALQDAGGMAFENYVGLESYSMEEMLGQAFSSFTIGGTVGFAGAVAGTSSYNAKVRADNKRIREVVSKYYPEMDTEEVAATASALQGIFYQEENKYLDEFNKLLDKENDPDTMPSGIGKENITAQTRELLKNKYGMTDEQIDKTCEIAELSIDLRNQFNEAYNDFYEQMVKAGAKPQAAEQASRIVAARASTVAMNEKTSVNEVLKRWGLRFAESDTGALNWQEDQDTRKNKKQNRQEISELVEQLKNRTNKTRKDNRTSLIQFLKKKGGLQDVGGDLKNMDAGKSAIGLINKNGLSLDDATQMAWENGYLQSNERPEINALLDAVDTELRGTKIYSALDSNEKAENNKALDSWEQAFNEADVDIYKDDIDTIQTKLDAYQAKNKEAVNSQKLISSEADEERLAMMEENGLSRNQALEQLSQQKDNRTATEILLDDSIPFYQDDVDIAQETERLFKPTRIEKNNYISDLRSAEQFAGNEKKLIRLGELPAVYKAIGIPSANVNTNKKTVIKDAVKKHAVPMKVVETLPELYADPIMVFKALDKSTNKNSYVAVLDAYDKDGKQMIAAISPTNRDSGYHMITSFYGRNNIENMIETAFIEKKVKYIRNKKNSLLTGHNAYLSQADNNILQKEDIVNKSFYQLQAKYNNLDNSLSQDGKSGHRGQYDAANRIITLFSTADPSTIIHETAHFFLDDMRRFSYNKETANELAAIYRYVGSLDGNISREQHEYFARSFEAYLMEGKAPNQLLRRAFVKFKNWLSFIYGNIKKLDVDLDNNIRKTFDEMLGGKKLDFAMQMSSQNMLANAKSGYIPQNVINKAMALLDSGKMSKTDMNTMIEKIKNHELRRTDVRKYLEPFSKSNNINHENISESEKMFMRQQLENGNVTPKMIRKKIDRLLEWSKPRSVNGKLVGRFTDIKVNRFFDHIRETFALSKEEAQAKINENMQIIDNITKGEETGNIAELVWNNKLLSFPAGKANISLQAEVYSAISDSYNAGRLVNAVTGEVKKAYRQRLINEAIATLDQGKGQNWRKSSSKTVQAIRRFGISNFSWNGILDILSMFDKTSLSNQSKLNKRLNIFEEEKKMRVGIFNDGEIISKLVGDALSANKNNAISVSRYVNNELPKKFQIDWGSNSKTFTKDELLDIWMKAQDPDTKDIMLNDDVLQFNEGFLRKVDELLTEDDIAVANALFKFYEQDYNKINDFYEQHYGISLGRSEYYSPRSMDRSGINVSTGDLRSYAGLSAIKQRKAKGGQIKPKGAFAVLQNHINNVNHYINFSEKLQDINVVLGDPEVKNRIRNLFGEEMNKKIAYEVSRFANNDKQFTDGVGKIMSKLRANYAVSVLALKPALAIKQLTSFPAYWENISTAEFLAGLADFAAHPDEAIKTLAASDYMKTRGVNIIKDLEVVSTLDMFKNLGKGIKLRDWLMLNIQLGDRGAIYLGGWALYKAVLKKTGSKEKAMAEFERVTNETQQSSYMNEQSKWQSNQFLNWFTMFQSSQNQYLRKELTALRGLVTGRMPKGQVFKTLFIYHFLLPMFFQAVADGFRWDKDAQLRAGLLGSLNGVFVLGKVMERLIDWGITQKLNYKLGIRELLPPISVFEDMGRFLNDSVKFAEDDIDLEDYVDALKRLAKTTGEMSGLPIKYPMDVISSSGDYAENKEYGKLGLLMLGWSPYALRDFDED